MKILAYSVLIIALLVSSSYAETESLRCGNKIISLGDHKVEVAQKCGEPHTKGTIGVKNEILPRDLRRRFGGKAVQEVFVDEWTYDTDKTTKIRKTKRIIRLLFEANNLVKIETLIK